MLFRSDQILLSGFLPVLVSLEIKQQAGLSCIGKYGQPQELPSAATERGS